MHVVLSLASCALLRVLSVFRFHCTAVPPHLGVLSADTAQGMKAVLRGYVARGFGTETRTRERECEIGSKARRVADETDDVGNDDNESSLIGSMRWVCL
jgi:hypothetical protein